MLTVTRVTFLNSVHQQMHYVTGQWRSKLYRYSAAIQGPHTTRWVPQVLSKGQWAETAASYRVHTHYFVTPLALKKTRIFVEMENHLWRALKCTVIVIET